MDLIPVWWLEAISLMSAWSASTADRALAFAFVPQTARNAVVETIVELGNSQLFVSSSFVLALLVTLLVLAVIRRILYSSPRISSKVQAVKNFVAPGEGPRFRKRDRIAFLSTRAMRSAKAVGTLIRGGQGKKRRAMARLVKRVFAGSGPPGRGLLAPEEPARPDLPDEYLEEDRSSIDVAETVPEALILVIKNLRVFGHFENMILLELVKNIEYVSVRQNEYLFRVGEPDDNMYIVESGALSLLCASPDALDSTPTMELKVVRSGEPIISLLSFIEHLAGKRKHYKTVSAKAQFDSRVIRFSFESFRSAFDKCPESLSRVVQVVMVRLQRVTLLALHHYLGLGSELISTQARGALLRKQHSSGGAEGSSTPAAMFPVSPSRCLSVPDGSAPTSKEVVPLQHSASVEDEPGCNLINFFRARKKIAAMSEEQLRAFSIEVFKKMLSLQEEDLLHEASQEETFLADVEIVTFEEGQVLAEEDSVGRSTLFLVLTGCVSVSQRSTENVPKELHKAVGGGLLGQLQVLTNEPNFFTYTAIQPTRVALLNGHSVRSLMTHHPHVALQLAMSVIDQMSPYVRSIDFALEWMLVESGKALYKQDSKADSTYVILSGRLRSVITRQASGEKKRELVADHGRGELCGIVETLMKTPRSTTVIAVRDTEVAKLPAGLLDFIKLRFPNVLMRLIKLLGQKLQQSWEKGPDPRSLHMPASVNVTAQSNFSTVAIIPLSPNIPIGSFTLELLHALNQVDLAIRVTKDYVLNELGSEALDRSADFRLSSWLTQLEDKHRIVLYQCDRDLSAWTRLCVRHADVIYVLVDPTGPYTVTPLEENLESYSRRTSKEMIFLHRDTVKYPTGTSNWLLNRGWINAHYHVRCPPRMFFKKKEENVELMYGRILNSGAVPDVHSDFSRLARMVTGTSVGLVLGGGGARGCSHVGMIKAILESGIPIDSVAGVSIGSLIGALWCQERDLKEMTLKARQFSMKMTQRWRQALDLTYPHTAYFSGRVFNSLIEELFGDRDISDLWLPYLTITTDLTESSMRVHDYGSLWRYVRGSMSLAGYMPPICDPHDGHLLVDGGYVNNLPADISRTRLRAKHVLAVDVGAQDDVSFTNYGDWLSGFRVLLSKWSPFREAINVPNQADIQSRLAYVSCVSKLEIVKAADYCDYIRPPIDKYGTLQFGSFDEIKEVGYYHGKTYFSGLMKAGLLRQFLNRSAAPPRPTHFTLPNAMRRGSMDNLASSLDSNSVGAAGLESAGHSSSAPRTDLSNLAEMVCSVRQPFVVPRSQDDTDDEEDGMTEEASETDMSDDDDEEEEGESGFMSQF